ncbi:MAG: aspartate--tRNA ligase [Patescibacteria group bacterium]|jgi:aspartyl-tRNA synthetase
MKRTNTIESAEKIGQEVLLKGWVHSRRNMGKLIFIDLRDKSGQVQVVFLPNNKELIKKADQLGLEYVVAIKGKVNARPPKQVKKETPTGTVEIEALDLEIINKAAVTPFEIKDQFKEEVNEELRLKYRYLDLRRERMKKNLVLRHDVVRFMREYFYKQGFTEIETPFLSKSTPEGARDFLVPSRNFKGKFYALPQSPQQYKQMLMVAGMEKYFQVVRCFRDEDARGDRQVEFTQLDVEKSFTDQEEILNLIEKLIIELVAKVCPEKKIAQTPFPRISYEDSMAKYKNDRPDMRKDKKDKNELAFCWVTDFPMFEKKDDGTWGATHHPFTAIQEKDLPKLKERKLESIKAQQYDLALNGNEIFGGSIRTHDPEILSEVFQALGHSKEEIQAKFGHLLEAFKYGVPPHGGIACGLDRLVMVLAGEESIREVIAFPKTLEGRDPLMDSPSSVDKAQLKELGL